MQSDIKKPLRRKIALRNRSNRLQVIVDAHVQSEKAKLPSS